jgi:hypothetical protein
MLAGPLCSFFNQLNTFFTSLALLGASSLLFCEFRDEIRDYLFLGRELGSHVLQLRA